MAKHADIKAGVVGNDLPPCKDVSMVGQSKSKVGDDATSAAVIPWIMTL
jgi:hypothetical protein